MAYNLGYIDKNDFHPSLSEDSQRDDMRLNRRFRPARIGSEESQGGGRRLSVEVDQLNNFDGNSIFLLPVRVYNNIIITRGGSRMRVFCATIPNG